MQILISASAAISLHSFQKTKVLTEVGFNSNINNLNNAIQDHDREWSDGFLLNLCIKSTFYVFLKLEIRQLMDWLETKYESTACRKITTQNAR